MTQGDLLPPIIFNVVVGAVVCHWVSLVVVGAGGKEGWWGEVHHRAAFFYAYDGIVAFNDTGWMQVAVDTFTSFFKRAPDKIWEDSRDYIEPLTCGWYPVGGGLRSSDDGRGPNLLSPPVATSALPRMLSVHCHRGRLRPTNRRSVALDWEISGIPPPHTHTHARTTYVLYLLQKCDGNAGLPSQGV